MSTTVYRRGRVYHNGSRVDNGYSSALANATAGAMTSGSYGGQAPNRAITGPELTADEDTGNLWVALNGEWVFTGVTIPIS